MSEILVGSIAETAESVGLSQFFIGAIIVAIVGNAAEHWVAVYVAAKDKMDLAINIAIGSPRRSRCSSARCSSLISFFVGPKPLALVFNGFELAGLLLAVIIASHVAERGRVDLVRGPDAAGRLHGDGGHVPVRLDIRREGAPTNGPDARVRQC